MPVTIDRRHRQAIYELLVCDLSGVGDIYLALREPDADYARQLRARFEQDMRLLDDLGWHGAVAREAFAITMPEQQLTQLLRRLHDGTGAELAAFLRERHEAVSAAETSLIALGALGDVLAQLAAPATHAIRSAA